MKIFWKSQYKSSTACFRAALNYLYTGTRKRVVLMEFYELAPITGKLELKR